MFIIQCIQSMCDKCFKFSNSISDKKYIILLITYISQEYGAN